MLRVLTFSMLLALSLAHDGGGGSSRESGEKKGHCPNHGLSANSSLPDCPALCANGTDCTTLNCTSDTNCADALKCCETTCGLKCISCIWDPVCSTNSDCAGSLVCCRRKCKAICPTAKPIITPKKGKHMKGKPK